MRLINESFDGWGAAVKKFDETVVEDGIKKGKDLAREKLDEYEKMANDKLEEMEKKMSYDVPCKYSCAALAGCAVCGACGVGLCSCLGLANCAMCSGCVGGSFCTYCECCHEKCCKSKEEAPEPTADDWGDQAFKNSSCHYNKCCCTSCPKWCGGQGNGSAGYDNGVAKRNAPLRLNKKKAEYESAEGGFDPSNPFGWIEKEKARIQRNLEHEAKVSQDALVDKGKRIAAHGVHVKTGCASCNPCPCGGYC
jgi:hypothetical protein